MSATTDDSLTYRARSSDMPWLYNGSSPSPLLMVNQFRFAARRSIRHECFAQVSQQNRPALWSDFQCLLVLVTALWVLLIIPLVASRS